MSGEHNGGRDGESNGGSGGRGDDSGDNSFDTGRFGRLIGLIGVVTAVSLLTSAQVLPNDLFSIAVVAIGSVALVTAITGFLIAGAATYDEQTHRTER